MSELRANTISAANGTDPVTLTKQNAAKAWVNFAGKNTIGINDSMGVSGLVDNGTGNYSVSLSSAMTDTNYPVFTSASAATSYGSAVSFDPNDDNVPRTTTSITLISYFSTSFIDRLVVAVVVHGGLA